MTEPKGSRFDSRRSGFGAGRAPVSRLPLLEVAALQLLAIGHSSQHTHPTSDFFSALHETASGPKRTSLVVLPMSAIGGKANVDQPGS
jgi:hypothetical protein